MHWNKKGVCCVGSGRTLFALIAMTVLLDAFAQSSPEMRYPWDKRPDVCLQAAATKDARCILDNWPSWKETLTRVSDLYSAEQFALLERAMRELTSSGKVFVNGDSPASAAYWAFRRLMPGPGTSGTHQEKISRWAKTVPKSDYATFAQARFLYGMAWNVRGSGTGGSVSKESWELFGIRLREAEQLLLGGSEALKATPLWHNLLLAITLDNPIAKSDVEKIFQDGVARWPRYFDLYELRLTRLVPKWGGSWDQVESFIDKWTNKLAATEGTSIYARLYISVKNQGVTPEQTKMNWGRMKVSLEDLISRYPAPKFKNLYASYACFARDKRAFDAALASFKPGELMLGEWISGHSYEACMRWAGI